VHRNACRLSGGIQTRNNFVFAIFVNSESLARISSRYTTHCGSLATKTTSDGGILTVIVYSRQHRDRLLGDIDTTEDSSRLGNTRKPLLKHFSRKVTKLQKEVILLRTHATTFTDFDGHATRYDIARGKILRRRRISLHKPFAFGVQ
jgi:hypothetical protein